MRRLLGVLVAVQLIIGCDAKLSPVPLGTWKDTELSRYMIIEPSGESSRHYKVMLFTQLGSSAKRQVSATIKDGVLVLKTAEADIPVLYHPSGDLILINGQSTFRRVTLNDAQIPIRDHHSSVERSGVY